MPDKELVRFLDAQNQMYMTALSEVQNGIKKSHWMWFIFPQIEGLGTSETARYFGIRGIHEATRYLDHPVLGKHLIEISNAVLTVGGKTANQIFGTPDDLKLRSCMTLFAAVENSNAVFSQVLYKYFNGQPDALTLSILEKGS
jgi:uncharacterized protein (DUF1810 family)